MNKRKAHLRSVMIVIGNKKTRSVDQWQIQVLACDINLLEDNGNDPIVISTVIGT